MLILNTKQFYLKIQIIIKHYLYKPVVSERKQYK